MSFLVNKHKEIVGILGAGKLSVVLSQLALDAGYTVYISNSKDPRDLKLTFSVLSPGAHVVTRNELISLSNVIILAMPLSKYQSIPKDALNGKTVIDAMNYWWEVDGDIHAFHSSHKSSSEQVQEYFVGARVTKALNHVGYHDLFDHAAVKGSPGRRGVAFASDYNDDTDTVSRIINNLGFDPLYIGLLEQGAKLEPGTKVFGSSLPIDELNILIT